MPYYLRVFSSATETPSIAELTDRLAEEGVSGIRFEIEKGTAAVWDQAVLSLSTGEPVCVLERSVRGRDSLAEDEIEEFRTALTDLSPRAGAEWTREFLASANMIVAMQLLNAAFDDESAIKAYGVVLQAIRTSTGGIIQADGEGFSNREGRHIVWDFSDEVSGEWNMAVLLDGRWKSFTMELDNEDNRAAFRRGEIPTGVLID